MKKKHLQTQFVKFIIEKYGKEQDVEPQKEIQVEDDENYDDESIEDDDKLEVEPKKKKSKIKDDEDSIIDELLTEYKNLRKQYDKIYNKRK